MSSTHTNLLFHIVYSTKYRRNIINVDIRKRLYEYIGGILRENKGTLLEIGGMPDHVHLLAKLSPSFAISDVLRLVKTNSSKWVNETFAMNSPFAWQRGFGAFSVSMSSVADVEKYVKLQEEHHRKLTFRDEYRLLLKRHGIEFDERYLFEEENVS
ncbi:IS200/IS605 family transposase [Aureliella helgolandensis]|uniref:Transposase IS200 like protein n=1 Tax=Aureliella helgolandensis TaxID=2527968 RepID=A0A518GET6_9BACT|nr:IS200/IS605 family transposase [Aureliella helgolandensis]QDV27103.1 Transposase IS200 like protein [Aureliella helgolandensis]